MLWVGAFHIAALPVSLCGTWLHLGYRHWAKGRSAYLPFRVAELWDGLSEGMRASILRMDVASVAVVRGLFDVAAEDALEFVGESGVG